MMQTILGVYWHFLITSISPYKILQKYISRTSQPERAEGTKAMEVVRNSQEAPGSLTGSQELVESMDCMLPQVICLHQMSIYVCLKLHAQNICMYLAMLLAAIVNILTCLTKPSRLLSLLMAMVIWPMYLGMSEG